MVIILLLEASSRVLSPWPMLQQVMLCHRVYSAERLGRYQWGLHDSKGFFFVFAEALGHRAKSPGRQRKRRDGVRGTSTVGRPEQQILARIKADSFTKPHRDKEACNYCRKDNHP